MLKKFKSHLPFIYISLFYISLIFFDNHINSKVILIGLLLSLILFNKEKTKKTICDNYPLLILFFLIIFSLTYTINIDYGLKKVERLLIIPVAILMASSLGKIRFKIIALVFIIISLIATLYSHSIVLIEFLANNETSYKHFFNLNYSYQALANTINLHSTYYSLYILTALVFITFFLEKKTTSLLVKITLTILFLYFSVFLVQLSSRMAIGALYLVIVFNIVKHIVNRKKIIQGLLILVLFHSIAFVVIMNIGVTKYRFQHLLGFTYYTGYTVNDGNHKINLWTAAINANDNIIIGNGIGDVQESLNKQYLKRGLKKELNAEYNSHNQYIQYYVGLGFVGLLFFLYILIYFSKKFIKNKNLIALQFLLIVYLMSLTECLWDRHNGIVFITFTLLLLSKCDYKEENLFTDEESCKLLKVKADSMTNSNKNLV